MTQFPWSRVQILTNLRWSGDHWEVRSQSTRIIPESHRRECVALIELLVNTKSGAGTEKC
jgi:hypothetical protein